MGFLLLSALGFIAFGLYCVFAWFQLDQALSEEWGDDELTDEEWAELERQLDQK